MKNPFSGIMDLAKKNPVATVGAVAVAVIAGLLVSRKQTSTETVVQAAPVTDDEEQSTPDYSGLFSDITDSLESMDERISAYGIATGESLDSVATQNRSALETISSRLAGVIEDRNNVAAPVMPTTPIVPEKTVPVGPSVAEQIFASQVAAAKQIKDLQAAWQAVPAGPKQEAQRAAYNIEANRISVVAGFGSGGDTGSARVIPEAVKIAAGV